jgi:2-hydroxy-3-keto-5-methylthiopentenyl-1-phosphate phosphatase
VSPDVPRAPSATVDAAPAVGPLVAGAVPLAILVDYDGTIALTDVGDTIMAEHVPGAWEEMSAVYDAGRMGSRRLMEAELGMVDAPDGGAALLATAAAQPHDPGFVPFVRRAQAAGIPVEVVSDGFGFYIGPAMASLGLGDVPVVTNRTIFVDGGARVDFPNGHPTCFICGTCKRARVLAHRAAGRAVVFIGDGESDRYAAGHADVIFAKRALVPICVANRWPFRRWTDFAEIDLWLARTIDAWRADPDSPDLPRPAPRPFSCGPEVWGPGLYDPPEPA